MDKYFYVKQILEDCGYCGYSHGPNDNGLDIINATYKKFLDLDDVNKEVIAATKAREKAIEIAHAADKQGQMEVAKIAHQKAKEFKKMINDG
jgi:hypothetical protein